MFELAHGYRDTGMSAYSALQEQEFALEKSHGYRAVKHQSFVGAGYFDQVNEAIMAGNTSTKALEGSTEHEQFSEQTPDFTEAEVHHIGGGELEEVPKGSDLIPPSSH